MAGIGFELRKILKRDSLLSLIQAYAYAGIISSGAWMLSIIGILVIGIFSLSVVVPNVLVTQFQVSVTYLIAISLCLTGFVQLSFTRFTADRLFEKKDDVILPNFNGLMLGTTFISGVLGLLAILFLFPHQNLIYRLLMLSGFVVMSDIWIATIFLSGMKHYKAILFMFAVGYSLTVIFSLVLRRFGLEGLLGGFVLGQFILLVGMLTSILYYYPSSHFISFIFLRKSYLYPTLMIVGFFYNFGIWIDKFIFWFNAETSIHVIGALRASPIYDVPIFLSYIFIVPGMAVFLMKMETEFVDYYNRYYDAVRSGGSLQYIESMRYEMIYTARRGIFQIINIQIIAALTVLVTGNTILTWLGISTLYLPLLFVNLISVGLQVVFLSLLNIFFYLDRRYITLTLTGLFVVFNGVLTTATIWLGPAFYGYGFALALMLVVMLGFHLLSRTFDNLEYDTFMLQ
jgi:uncharacterized membrane protein